MSQLITHIHPHIVRTERLRHCASSCSVKTGHTTARFGSTTMTTTTSTSNVSVVCVWVSQTLRRCRYVWMQFDRHKESQLNGGGGCGGVGGGGGCLHRLMHCGRASAQPQRTQELQLQLGKAAVAINISQPCGTRPSDSANRRRRSQPGHHHKHRRIITRAGAALTLTCKPESQSCGVYVDDDDNTTATNGVDRRTTTTTTSTTFCSVGYRC